MEFGKIKFGQLLNVMTEGALIRVWYGYDKEKETYQGSGYLQTWDKEKATIIEADDSFGYNVKTTYLSLNNNVMIVEPNIYEDDSKISVMHICLADDDNCF